MKHEHKEIEELRRRLERMERRSRRFQVLVAVSIAVIASTSIVTAQLRPFQETVRPSERPEISLPPQLVDDFLGGESPVEERILSREFMLVDEAGNHRASLVADNAGSTFLTLMDADENLRASLSVMNRGPALTFYDPDGRVRMVLGSTSLVGSHVEAADGTLERDTPASIVMFDEEGTLVWREP